MRNIIIAVGLLLSASGHVQAVEPLRPARLHEVYRYLLQRENRPVLMAAIKKDWRLSDLRPSMIGSLAAGIGLTVHNPARILGNFVGVPIAVGTMAIASTVVTLCRAPYHAIEQIEARGDTIPPAIQKRQLLRRVAGLRRQVAEGS